MVDKTISCVSEERICISRMCDWFVEWYWEVRKEDTKVLFGVGLLEVLGDAYVSMSKFEYLYQCWGSEVMQAAYVDGSFEKFGYVRGVHKWAGLKRGRSGAMYVFI